MNKLIKFGAPWCSHCVILAESIDEVDIKGFYFVDINTDLNPSIARKYEVKGLPTVVIEDASGTELIRFSGSMTPEILEQTIAPYRI